MLKKWLVSIPLTAVIVVFLIKQPTETASLQEATRTPKSVGHVALQPPKLGTELETQDHTEVTTAAGNIDNSAPKAINTDSSEDNKTNSIPSFNDELQSQSETWFGLINPNLSNYQQIKKQFLYSSKNLIVDDGKIYTRIVKGNREYVMMTTLDAMQEFNLDPETAFEKTYNALRESEQLGDWSAKLEQNFYQLLIKLNVINQISVSYIECRGKVCLADVSGLTAELLDSMEKKVLATKGLCNCLITGAAGMSNTGLIKYIEGV